MSRLEAYERFKVRLGSGELKPGQFVTQRELADLIGVPVGTAREAIQRLEYESLVKVYPQRGIQITEVSVRLIKEAFQFRSILEAAAVRHFAAAGPLADIDRLLAQTADVLGRAAGRIDEALARAAVEVDWTMHDTIVDGLGNSILSEVYRVNAGRIRLIRANNGLSGDRLRAVLTEHLTVLSACRARDPDAAESALLAHLEAARGRALDGQ
jgi:DNA-binding GntR family transcriptional regulator